MEDDIRELPKEIDKIRSSCSWVCVKLQSLQLKVEAARDLNAELKEKLNELIERRGGEEPPHPALTRHLPQRGKARKETER